MILLPRTKAPSLIDPSPNAAADAVEETTPGHQILLTSSTGSIAVLTPLSEPQYRRLNTLTSHLTNTLYHPLGLNPRAYRVDKENDGGGLAGTRTIVDGGVVGRWMELGSQRRAEIAGRVGVGVDEVREELVQLGSGLGYL
jgi:cleavage and polyadenylation specificity factor subunit 1